VPRKTATRACLQAAELEIDVVVHDEHIRRLDLIEARCCGDRASRVVHVRLRLEERQPVILDPNIRDAAVELGSKGRRVPSPELVDDHPADVVPVTLVARARVAEPCDEQLERRG
jgi:hypothetical protein